MITFSSKTDTSAVDTLDLVCCNLSGKQDDAGGTSALHYPSLY